MRFLARLILPSRSCGKEWMSSLPHSVWRAVPISGHVDIISSRTVKLSEIWQIGTPIQRGVSGGQKRRVTVGTGLVTLSVHLYSRLAYQPDFESAHGSCFWTSQPVYVAWYPNGPG